MKFTINIEEYINQEFEIEANNSSEALEIAIQKYKNSEIVLENPYISGRQIAIAKPNGEDVAWVEF